MLYIKQALTVDPSVGIHEVMDILIDEGIIIDIAQSLIPPIECRCVHCPDLLVVPGLIDCHVHLREPGFEHKETIETGLTAAVAGGFTAVCAMPNTKPVVDNAITVKELVRKSKDYALAKLFPIGSITKEQKGEQLSEMGEMLNAGAVAFSDDGFPVSNSLIFRRALEYLKQFNGLVITHNEDVGLSNHGAMNEGYNSLVLGLPGIHRAAEESAIARDIEIAKYFGPIHIAHVSTKGSVDIIRFAKQRGIQVTAETAPHYFSLTDELLTTYNAHYKMNPPLRSEIDRRAIIEGLRDGTLDMIATDHAPHHSDDKNVDFEAASFGIVGLETAVGVTFKVLVEQEGFPLDQVVRLMSTHPSRLLGKEAEYVLKKGALANVTVIQMNWPTTVQDKKFKSKGKNSPFIGWEFGVRPYMTIVEGRIVYQVEKS